MNLCDVLFSFGPIDRVRPGASVILEPALGALSVSLLFSWSSCSLTRNVRSTNPRVAQSTRCEDFWSLLLASGSVKEVAACVQNRYRLIRLPGADKQNKDCQDLA
jgi:hypothetical protein